MVSKYIGEMERNLRRVFDAAEAGVAILFFEEAVDLFGRCGTAARQASGLVPSRDVALCPHPVIQKATETAEPERPLAGKPLRTAVSLYLALGVAGGLLLSGYVFWIEYV